MKEDEFASGLPAILPEIKVIDMKKTLSNLLGYFGPAFIVSVAYMNPGNVGIAIGSSLPEDCGRTFSRKVNWGLWSVATIAAMATDLAEFLGGVLGFHLLLNLSYICSILLTAAVTYAICYLQKYGQKTVERIITAMIGVISLCYVWEMFIAKPDWWQVTYHMLRTVRAIFTAYSVHQS